MQRTFSLFLAIGLCVLMAQPVALEKNRSLPRFADSFRPPLA